MRKHTTIAFITLLLIQCSPKKDVLDNEIIELPISIETGYGPFHASLTKKSLKEYSADSEWGKTIVETTGIPEDWNEPILEQIWFDANQFAFQNYHQKNISKSFFERLKKSWDIDVESKTLSKETIMCFTSIVMVKDEKGRIKYKIDTNNDQDFSDETEVSPPRWDKIDSLSQHSQSLIGETFVNDEITKVNLPISIVSDEGSLYYGFPQYAKTEMFGKPIYINSGFRDINFKEESNICIGDPVNGKTKDIFELNEYFNIEGSVFQNLGIDFNKQILKIKKMPDDTLIYSPKAGFPASPFEAKDFLTDQSISLKKYNGKYVFVEFWGTWCTPCIQEIPNMISVYDAIDKSKIAFLGIANDEPKKLKKFLHENEMPWEQVIPDGKNNLLDLYNINSYPTSFLINDKGEIVAKGLRGENLLDTLNYYIQ